MANSNRSEIKPAIAAITVGLSFFVGVMELFVAVLAFAVAGRQGNPNLGSDLGWSNSTAGAVAYAVGLISILNSVVSFGRARLRPVITALCTVVLLGTALLANLLFVRAW